MHLLQSWIGWSSPDVTLLRSKKFHKLCFLSDTNEAESFFTIPACEQQKHSFDFLAKVQNCNKQIQLATETWPNSTHTRVMPSLSLSHTHTQTLPHLNEDWRAATRSCKKNLTHSQSRSSRPSLWGSFLLSGFGLIRSTVCMFLFLLWRS